MQKITPFLWFDGKLDEAIAQYTALFPGSEVLEAHGPKGSLMSARLRLGGQEYLLFNGGPH